MPRENDKISGANNSKYAELAGEGPGASGAIENQSPSIGRQEGQATIRTAENLNKEIDSANRDYVENEGAQQSRHQDDAATDRPVEGSREDADNSEHQNSRERSNTREDSQTASTQNERASKTAREMKSPNNQDSWGDTRENQNRDGQDIYQPHHRVDAEGAHPQEGQAPSANSKSYEKENSF